MTPDKERDCRFCERRVGVTPSGHLRAHACPHGRACVLSYVARRRGDKVKRCAECAKGRQQTLPFGEYALWPADAKGPIQKGTCKYCGVPCILFESRSMGGWYTGHEQPMCEAFRDHATMVEINEAIRDAYAELNQPS